MDIGKNKGLIIIALGIILTIFNVVIGILVTLIGVYFLYNQSNKEIEDKKNELAIIDNQMNQKLEEKQNEINNIDAKLQEMEYQKEQEIDQKLQAKNSELNNIDNKLQEMEYQKENEINEKLKDKQDQLQRIDQELNMKKDMLVSVEDELIAEESGLFQPQYDFINSQMYKDKLKQIRQEQKIRIKNKTAAVCDIEWTVDGSKQKGNAMTNANIKQILTSFNLECEITINKVTYANREKSIEKIRKSYDKLNKLNEKNKVRITREYLNLKLQELELAFEYDLKKQEEKEILREEREQEKEERKIQKQLDKQEKEINNKKQSLENEKRAAEKELTESKSDQEKEQLKQKIQDLTRELRKKTEEQEQITEKRTRTGAGFVYIISNIGSFGEDVYKIGVTRRDKPEDRVNELSNASVPFKYDSHAYIFSKDAFKLEKELHDKFDKNRVNKINIRKEFFKLTPEEVKEVVENNKDSVYNFNMIPEAQEYHDTKKIEKQQS